MCLFFKNHNQLLQGKGLFASFSTSLDLHMMLKFLPALESLNEFINYQVVLNSLCECWGMFKDN